MPQIFRIGAYVIYFWANESDPLEPVHVHVVKGTPTANKTLNDIMAIIEARNIDIISKWYSFFGKISYYC